MLRLHACPYSRLAKLSLNTKSPQQKSQSRKIYLPAYWRDHFFRSKNYFLVIIKGKKKKGLAMDKSSLQSCEVLLAWKETIPAALCCSPHLWSISIPAAGRARSWGVGGCCRRAEGIAGKHPGRRSPNLFSNKAWRTFSEVCLPRASQVC